MIIDQLRMKSFQPFRGEHTLKLDAKAYAVFARRASDPESSNWAGKSSLLEAVWFAVSGEHRHRLDDEWISIGEPSGEVELQLSTGERILRSRPRGKRTTLYLTLPGMREPMIQDEAQRALDGIVGLSREDFVRTCYFQQRRMSRFVTDDPADRMKTVSGWLRLEPLVRGAASVARRAENLEKEATVTEALLAEADRREKVLVADGAEDDAKESAAAEEVERLRGSASLLQDEVERNAHRLAAATRKTEFDQIVSLGKQASEEAKKHDVVKLKVARDSAQRMHEEKTVLFREAQRDFDEKRRVARGEFDGRCPVAGIDCPAKDRINAGTKEGRAAADDASAKARTSCSASTEAGEQARRAEGELQAAERIHARLDSLREQARRLKGLLEQAKNLGEAVDAASLRSRLDRERELLHEAQRRLDHTRAQRSELAAIREQRVKLIDRRADYSGKLGVLREGAAVFGKQGAQRRVAEQALARIEDDANVILRECGVSLSVEVRWSREGKGLARACESCGQPFPSSAKIKQCERCNQPRGFQLESKLDVALSDRSGAAEDLGGAAVQLAASRWLRLGRGAVWSTAMLDEPFGSLDASNRRALGRHLAAMLSGRYGFEQSFITAHSPDVLNALPGRIEIVQDGRWSTPKVIA